MGRTGRGRAAGRRDARPVGPWGLSAAILTKVAATMQVPVAATNAVRRDAVFLTGCPCFAIGLPCFATGFPCSLQLGQRRHGPLAEGGSQVRAGLEFAPETGLERHARLVRDS